MFHTEEIKEKLNNFIKQTNSSTFKIDCDGWEVDYHISLNHFVEGKKFFNNDFLPLLKINNVDLFASKLTILLNLKAKFHEFDLEYFDFSRDNYMDYLLMSSFINMCEDDFNYPLNYLDRMIEAYTRKYSINKLSLIGCLNLTDKKLNIYESSSKNIASMESPLYKVFIFTDENEKFVTPKIHYYIANDTVYIMGIQGLKERQSNSLSKRLDRYFRKVDAGLEEIEKSENDKIETLKDISPSFLVALTLFISSFKDYKKFYLVDYLPLRYQNKLGVLKQQGKDLESADALQKNITNKFMFTGARFCEHFENADFEFVNSYLKINVETYNHQCGNIIYDLYESIKIKQNKNLKKI